MKYVPFLFIGGPYHGTWAPLREDAQTCNRPRIPSVTAFQITSTEHPIVWSLEDTIDILRYRRQKIGGEFVMVLDERP